MYISRESEGLDCLGQRCLRNLTAQHVPRLWRDAGISYLHPELPQEQEALCLVSLPFPTEPLRLSALCADEVMGLQSCLPTGTLSGHGSGQQ